MSAACTLLLNNRAGALHATAGLDQMTRMVADLGCDAEVVGTESPDEMRARIRQLIDQGVKRIAVAGGDGTVSLAVQELAHTDVALGIIPQGTANNFATALRLPQDLPSALRVLIDGVVREVDLGKVAGHYFTEAAGVGLFADILALYGQGTNKNVVKGLYAMLRVLLHLKAHRLQLVVDGQPYGERAVMCTIANSYRMGMAVPVAPGAKVTDGALDMVLVGDLTLREVLPYYRAFRAQLQAHLPKVTTQRVQEVKIAARSALNVHCDDRVVAKTPTTITAQPRALNVLVDRL